jgi:DNA-binding NarL/FixJ family response regulator
VALRVVLVEDMQNVRRLLVEMLDAAGDFRVVHAVSTEAEARLWLEEHPQGWDLAIVDLVLEQGSGLGVIRPARQASAQATIAVLSSYATPGVEQHCRRLGADVVFDKADSAAFDTWLRALGQSARGASA